MLSGVPMAFKSVFEEDRPTVVSIRDKTKEEIIDVLTAVFI